MNATFAGLLERGEAGTALWRYVFSLSGGYSLVVLTSGEFLPNHRFNAWVVDRMDDDFTKTIVECGVLNHLVIGQINDNDMWLDGRNEAIQEIRARLIKYLDDGATHSLSVP